MVPQDTGWSWMVLIGASLQLMLTIGILKSSGILFVAFQERFDSSATTTSLLSTVQNLTYGVTAMFVMTIGVKLTTCRNLVFLGTLLNSAGFIITSKAVSIDVLLLSYGVLNELFQCVSVACTFYIVGCLHDVTGNYVVSYHLLGSIVILGGIIMLFLPRPKTKEIEIT
ncbi:monocarboxylate transporter 5-like [Mya arenaria]|uniref:monocarboxylate transporter 5-like n=1 Tax=Mya arenaria TaxID=6604 RepID=UPI0022E37BB9|nr:monocarboxylate transporter 5-like [Mya arenaria]